MPKTGILHYPEESKGVMLCEMSITLVISFCVHICRFPGHFRVHQYEVILVLLMEKTPRDLKVLWYILVGNTSNQQHRPTSRSSHKVDCYENQ